MEFKLSTRLGRLELCSPVIVGACPLTAEGLMRIAMVNNGAGAIVLPSLFEEQTMRKAPIAGNPEQDLSSYLSLVSSATQRTSVPVIASLNSTAAFDWSAAAESIVEAGADAIELFVRQPSVLEIRSTSEIEDEIVQSAKSLAATVEVPLLLKLPRIYHGVGALAQRVKPFVDGIVLFGVEPALDIELDSLQIRSSWECSSPVDNVPIFGSILSVRSHDPEIAIVGAGGIRSSEDLIKVMLAGANAAMITSAVYQKGATVIGTLLEGLITFMNRRQLTTLNCLAQLCPSIDLANSSTPNPHYLTSTHEAPRMHEKPGQPAMQTGECDRWGHPRS